MATSTRRFAWLPREPQPQPLSDKAVQIVQILQRFPKGLSASEIVKRSGGTFLVNHVYVYLRRLQSRGIVRVLPADKASGDRGQRDVLRATMAPGQIVRRQAGDGKAAAEGKRGADSRRGAAEPRRAEGRRGATARGAGETRRSGTESRRSHASAGH